MSKQQPFKQIVFTFILKKKDVYLYKLSNLALWHGSNFNSNVTLTRYLTALLVIIAWRPHNKHQFNLQNNMFSAYWVNWSWNRRLQYRYYLFGLFFTMLQIQTKAFMFGWHSSEKYYYTSVGYYCVTNMAVIWNDCYNEVDSLISLCLHMS